MVIFFLAAQFRRWFVAGMLVGLASTSTAQSVPPAATPSALAGPQTTIKSAMLEPLKKPSEVDTTYKTYLRQRYAGDQVALAGIHMFKRKQRGGVLWLLTGTAFITYLATHTGTTRTSNGTNVTLTVSPLGYVVFTGLFAGLGINKLSRFSNSKLYEAFLEYDRDHSFSNYVQARLKDKDYVGKRKEADSE